MAEPSGNLAEKVRPGGTKLSNDASADLCSHGCGWRGSNPRALWFVVMRPPIDDDALGWLCGRRVEHDAEDDRLHGVAAFEADCDGAADVLGLQRDESRRARK